jgi:hypothetical protein
MKVTSTAGRQYHVSLFPLPSFSLPPPSRSSSRGLCSRRQRLRSVLVVANQCVLSLNLLYLKCAVSSLPSLPRVPVPTSPFASFTSSASSTSPFSPSVLRLLDHVFRSAQRFVAEHRLRGSHDYTVTAGQVGVSSSTSFLLPNLRQLMLQPQPLSSKHQCASTGGTSHSSSSPLFPSSAPLVPSSSYSFPCSALPIIADRVSLPDVPQKVKMLDLLPTAMRDLYSRPDRLLCPPSARSFPSSDSSSQTAAVTIRPRVFGSRSEYQRLIRRMYDLGMVSFDSSPKCINGVFAVKKEESSQRLIIDARPANALFIRPPGVRLPDPSVLLNISVPSHETLYVAKNDIKDFYHSILLPEWLVPYFGLPPVDLRELGLLIPGVTGVVHPVCLTVPMGWSHAVLVAQIDHEHILYRANHLRREHNLMTMTMTG